MRSGEWGEQRVWLFNLYNTLHDASPHVFPHINRSMTSCVAEHLGMRTALICDMPRSPARVDLRLESVLELPRHMGRP